MRQARLAMDGKITCAAQYRFQRQSPIVAMNAHAWLASTMYNTGKNIHEAQTATPTSTGDYESKKRFVEQSVQGSFSQGPEMEEAPREYAEIFWSCARNGATLMCVGWGG